jgi:transcription initiation factor IIE alpha subunit
LHFTPKVEEKTQETQKETNGFRCPKCGSAMVVVDQIKSQRRRAPPD